MSGHFKKKKGWLNETIYGATYPASTLPSISKIAFTLCSAIVFIVPEYCEQAAKNNIVAAAVENERTILATEDAHKAMMMFHSMLIRNWLWELLLHNYQHFCFALIWTYEDTLVRLTYWIFTMIGFQNCSKV